VPDRGSSAADKGGVTVFHRQNDALVLPQVVIGFKGKARADPVTPTSPGRLSDPRSESEADAIMLDRSCPHVSGSA
jgi:hypothetical protein